MTSAAEAPAPAPALEKFPPTFYFANAIELFERLAHYGMYIGLSLYLYKVIGYDDVEGANVTANFRVVGSLSPIVAGAIADRIGFKRSLIVAFTLYSIGYLALFAFPVKGLAVAALTCMAIGGGFLKPVITGTVVRTAPPGRQTAGFAIFYRMVNAGSVVGKCLAYGMRVLVSLRYVMINSVAASLIALFLAIFGYTEPKRGAAKPAPLGETLRGYGTAFKNLRFTLFLVIFAGFYFMAEQFYMTFPKYVTRHIDAKAPMEIITLINPLCIALLQSRVTGLTKRLSPLGSMITGVLLGSLSMLVMGAVPTLVGACISGAIFALAEMTFSPRYYDYIASFAPEGKAGMYMGLAFVPFAIGARLGGWVSGPMIRDYLPEVGARSPFTVWGTYAAMGVVCAALMMVYRAVFGSGAEKVAAA
jgi:POT family proton-dependent oligopeptide transporter